MVFCWRRFKYIWIFHLGISILWGLLRLFMWVVSQWLALILVFEERDGHYYWLSDIFLTGPRWVPGGTTCFLNTNFPRSPYLLLKIFLGPLRRVLLYFLQGCWGGGGSLVLLWSHQPSNILRVFLCHMRCRIWRLLRDRLLLGSLVDNFLIYTICMGMHRSLDQDLGGDVL